MKRHHMFELEDQSWCPQIIRQTIVDTLRMAINLFGFYKETATLLRPALKSTHSTTIIDLCAGSGGPWKTLHKSFNTNTEHYNIYLTDINPNDTALKQLQDDTGNHVRYSPVSVSALNISTELNGFRTLFSSFHHFEPEMAQEIIADAVRSRQGIAIFEFTRRHPVAILSMAVAVMGPLLFVPFMRPFSWSRLLATYLIPVIPLAAAYDGIVSCLRTYTIEELEEFTLAFANQGYKWDVGNLKAGLSPTPLTYLIGYPVDNTAT